MSKTILVVDDEERLLSLLRADLKQEGFRVVTAPDGREALFVTRQEKPDLIVLDLMMPVMDGYEFMRRHRREQETPIIILTAKVEDSDKVQGLEQGADDYVTKPFSPRELAARVRAVLRRTGQTLPQAEILRAADITLDRGSHTVRVGDRLVNLTRSGFDLLGVLMSAPGRVFSRLQLLDVVQGEAFPVGAPAHARCYFRGEASRDPSPADGTRPLASHLDQFQITSSQLLNIVLLSFGRKGSSASHGALSKNTT